MSGSNPDERGGREPAEWAIGSAATAVMALILWGAGQTLGGW